MTPVLANRPRGTNDILPADVGRWQALEAVIRRLCRDFGYREIRTPLFEHTELFTRAAGEATDVVRKEMYTFLDRGDRSLTLRPEGTAPVVRAYLENKLYGEPQPVKLYYLSAPMFRYERPQSGRYRQHHQFGAEVFGSQDPALDAELISMPLELLRRLGVDGLRVKLNSLGCPQCRPAYREQLKAYYRPRLADVCADCRERFATNPLRLLDCKVPGCRAIRDGAPRMIDHLCGECADHFATLQAHLAALAIPFEIDARLVRGFDYYTKTVFEIVNDRLGAQDAVGGGGRYDGLVEELGGKPTPAAGFGFGMERLLLTLNTLGITLGEAEPLSVFIATADPSVRQNALTLLHRLRREGIAADMDYAGRSLKSQLRFADRYPARFVAVIGEEEIAAGTVTLRDLRTGEQETCPQAELAERLSRGPSGTAALSQDGR